MKAEWTKYRLHFRFTAITSRNRLTYKDTYYIKIWDESCPQTTGIGEAGLFKGLSIDDVPGYESHLTYVCENIEKYIGNTEPLAPYPSIRFGVETALLDLSNGGKRQLYDSEWLRGEHAIHINGLIWMGDMKTMKKRIDEKLSDGFSCIKVKIGGINFGQELELLKYIRTKAPYTEIRLDANGSFSPTEAIEKLSKLSQYDIHSIEQPIRPRQWAAMATICADSPIPIALDEELIGLNDDESRQRMLDSIGPHYIILKPTLTGGFSASDRWISLATERDIGWWATSALESNIGLNAIAQWTAAHDTRMPQGLGTGALYYNNIQSPLTLKNDRLTYDTETPWIIDI